MAIIHPAEFGSKVFTTTGTIYNPDGTRALAGPTASSNVPKDAAGKAHKEGNLDTVYTLPTNPLSFTLVPIGPVKRRVDFGPPGVTDKIIYLPYYVNNISATVIPVKDASVRFFITDPLSGCNFFIDRLPSGDLVCYHANARRHSTSPDDIKANAAAFNPLAPVAMNVQHSAARLGYPGAVNLASLRVADYYGKAQGEIDRKKDQGRSNVSLFGGTTIMGFRLNGKWEFWFQTYAQLEYERSGLLAIWKNKKVSPTLEGGGTGGGRWRILEARRFWH